MRMKQSSFLPLSLLLVIAGCAVQPVSGPAAMGVTVREAAPAAAAPQNPILRTGSGEEAVGAGVVATVKQPTATNGVVNVINIQAPGAKVPLGTPMAMSAANGGLYVSPDGSIRAKFPPGVLTKDATVRINRTDTAGQKVTGNYVPGVSFDVDLGGASLKADTALIVETKVDARFVDEMKKRDPKFSADKYSLTQDDKGNWFMAMAVKGATTKPAPAKVLDPEAMLLLEFGTLTVPGVAPRKLMGLSSSVDCQTWVDTIQIPVPKDMSEWRQRESEGHFSCAVYDKFDWYINIFKDLVTSGGTCTFTGSPGPISTDLKIVEVPSHVTFVSDDPAIDGKDGVGAKVRYDWTWSPNNGETDVVADSAGMAKSTTVESLPLSAYAYMDLGPVKGTPVDATAKEGMAPIELKIGKYSPLIKIDLTSEPPLDKELLVEYTIDGGEKQTATMSAPVGTKAMTGEFRVIVPDDNEHTFTITAARSGIETGLKLPLPEPVKVHRNAEYPVKLNLITIAPK